MANHLTTPCGCGNNQSTQAVCGSFDTDPENPDLGQCSPYRTKRSCDAPVKPENPCNEEGAYAVPIPGVNPPFYIVSKLYDENCELILDQNDAPILTIIK